ncbi:RNA polymerase II transcription regulator recruiting protein [Trichomonas vaginalis G3]|uniref:RNA polymerase II transcription regulator recruiting protein n=1 Tax=Trichomonas vaginalis (strain ATCC PRA-98 / G3) TaxID=412133 RepID=UPI0021E5B218|nr:RNA polymerase II transcription regulator recruiting protein [Trichomonas vaginalis G3]KAI5528046.1 RNA polymerase II transcription regulator recruiting protein [Trichomonas vaginalis G3]
MQCLSKKITGQRHKFTRAEDELLKSLVQVYGETKWALISEKMQTRSPRQCRERYKNYLSPKIQNSPWTPEEENLLIQKYQQLGPKWSIISVFFAPRSDVNVKNHWAVMMNRNQREKNLAQNTEMSSQYSSPTCNSPDPEPVRRKPIPLPMINSIRKELDDPFFDADYHILDDDCDLEFQFNYNL